MTTVSDIITEGYRESNFKAQVQTLTTEEESEALRKLQSIVDSFFGLVIGTKPFHWYIPRPQLTGNVEANFPATPGDTFNQQVFDTDYPPSNCRLFLKNTSATEVFFQYQPEDGAMYQVVDVGFTAPVTLNANGQLFGGVTSADTTVVISPRFPNNGRNAPRTYVYRADIASWNLVANLALADEFPFPAMLDDYFVTALAIRLAPRHGNEPSQATLMRYKDMMVFARGQYRQTLPAVVGDVGIPTEHSYGGRERLVNPDRGF